jgi:hypothetical protein
VKPPSHGKPNLRLIGRAREQGRSVLEALMKLEYLVDGSPDCPLLRLYHFTPAEAGQLLAAVCGVASGSEERVEVNRLAFVQPIGECQLILVRRSWDQAVLRVGRSQFECGFTADTWDNIAALIEPFAEGDGGFQWLASSPGEASILLSVSGHW